MHSLEKVTVFSLVMMISTVAEGTAVSTIVESGWCLDQNGEDQNKGVHSFPGRYTWDQCLQLCNAESGATGCEWNTGRQCACHTAAVSGGSGDPEYQCLKLDSEMRDASKCLDCSGCLNCQNVFCWTCVWNFGCSECRREKYCKC